MRSPRRADAAPEDERETPAFEPRDVRVSRLGDVVFFLGLLAAADVLLTDLLVARFAVVFVVILVPRLLADAFFGVVFFADAFFGVVFFTDAFVRVFFDAELRWVVFLVVLFFAGMRTS